MRNARARRQQCWKSCANGSNIVALRFGDHGTKKIFGVVSRKVWPVSNFVQEHATTSNNMQQGLQTDATCNIQQCWELLADNVASVRTGLKPVYITGNQRKKSVGYYDRTLLALFQTGWTLSFELLGWTLFLLNYKLVWIVLSLNS